MQSQRDKTTFKFSLNLDIASEYDKYQYFIYDTTFIFSAIVAKSKIQK